MEIFHGKVNSLMKYTVVKVTREYVMQKIIRVFKQIYMKSRFDLKASDLVPISFAV